MVGDTNLSQTTGAPLSDIDAKERLLLAHRMKDPLNQRHFSGAGFGAGFECTTHHFRGVI
jgi:hypothetical protein